MRRLLVLVLALLPITGAAQTVMTTDFPADAQPLSQERLAQAVSGKVFVVEPADGNRFRLYFRDNGDAFFDASTGLRDNGPWRVEGSKLCAEWQRARSGCSEVRIAGDRLLMKRFTNGEVVVMQPK